MTDKIDARLVQAVVLLDRQYRMLERVYEAGGQALASLEAAIDGKSTTINHVLDVYNYVLSLIDSLARYQKTAFSIPRLNQKDAEYRAFAAAMGDIKDARDQLQHLNNDIENDNSGPLLGGIAWTKGTRNYLVGLNDIGRSRSSPGIPFDAQERKYVSELCFTYGNVLYDLAKAMDGVRAFNAYIARKVRVEIDGKPYVADHHFVAICAAFLTEAEMLALKADQEAVLTARASET